MVEIMDEKPIELVLKDNSHVERSESSELRARALKLVNTANDSSNSALLPDTLLELLTQIIKPLFSKEQNRKITSTGRKILVRDGLPAALDRFSSNALFDNEQRPYWKNGWTASLLKYIVSYYVKIQDEAVRKKSLEAHFYQLVPPILHQIDDIDIVYKISGCRCLKLLCDTLRGVQSEILKRSGLADVFIEALKNDFSLLPTLTPEDDSIALYESLYPAYRSLVGARFPIPLANEDLSAALRHSFQKPRSTSSEEDLRQSYLTLLLRHQLLHSLAHLSTGIGGGSTSSIPLSTLLLSQVGWIFSDMGIAAVVHLQTMLPLLRNVLSDPFGTASPEMLFEAIGALANIVQVTWPRIREKWWGECLRGIVNCWLNIVDDEGDVSDPQRGSLLAEVKEKLRVVSWLLEDIVGEPLQTSKVDLIRQEPLLERLFEREV